MARYIGGSLAVAAAATVSTAVTNTYREAGAPAADELAAGLCRASLVLTIMSIAGLALALLVRRHRAARTRAIHRAAAAAVTAHTIPTQPATRDALGPRGLVCDRSRTVPRDACGWGKFARGRGDSRRPGRRDQPRERTVENAARPRG